MNEENGKIGPFGATICSLIMIAILAFFPGIIIKVVTSVFGVKWGWWWPCYGLGFIIMSVIVILTWIVVLNKKKKLQSNA